MSIVVHLKSMTLARNKARADLFRRNLGRSKAAVILQDDGKTGGLCWGFFPAAV